MGNSPIDSALLFLCSPHVGGVTDELGHAAAAGLEAAGVVPRIIKIGCYQIQACRGCGACLANGGQCALPADFADECFSAISTAPVLIFATPIYFYALPGQFKLFIDRSQKFWSGYQKGCGASRHAGVIMAAGRKNGERLFEGSLLTMKWFLEPFGFLLAQKLLLRGLDSLCDVSEQDRRGAFELGSKIGRMANPGISPL